MVVVNGFSFDDTKFKSGSDAKLGLGNKNGVVYFIKAYDMQEPVHDESMTESLFRKRMKKFEAFCARRKRVNAMLYSVSGPHGNIVCPLDTWICPEGLLAHRWMEVTEYIPGSVPDKELLTVLKKLRLEDKLMILRTAISALKVLHGSRMVHGDLKLENILLARREGSGVYAAKLIDFDGAFFLDDVPVEDLTGTMNYYSPEMGYYVSMPVEVREENRDMLSAATDIYALGLIFHQYMTGSFPEYDTVPKKLLERKNKGQAIYSFQISQAEWGGEDCHLKISREVSRNGKWLTALIADMIQCDPDDRPSAEDVLLRLKTRDLPYDFELWPEDQEKYVLQNEAVTGKYLGFKKKEISVYEGKKEVRKKVYKLMDQDGIYRVFTAEELKKKKIFTDAAPAEKPAPVKFVFEAPWPEDGIVWNQAMLEKSYVSGKRGEKPGQYIFRDHNGNTIIRILSKLVYAGFAEWISGSTKPAPEPKPAPAPKPSPEPEPAPTPGPVSLEWSDQLLWPKDRERYTTTAMKTGWKVQGPEIRNGREGYLFLDDKGFSRFLNTGKCLALGFLKAK